MPYGVRGVVSFHFPYVEHIHLVILMAQSIELIKRKFRRNLMKRFNFIRTERFSSLNLSDARSSEMNKVTITNFKNAINMWLHFPLYSLKRKFHQLEKFEEIQQNISPSWEPSSFRPFRPANWSSEANKPLITTELFKTLSAHDDTSLKKILSIYLNKSVEIRRNISTFCEAEINKHDLIMVFPIAFKLMLIF